MRPSNFAKFVRKFIKDDVVVYDLGCGDRRDTCYLGKKWITIGIDKKEGITVEGWIDRARPASLVYMRFFVHVIKDDLFHKILKWSKKWIAIEVRSDKNKKEYKTYRHRRYYRSSKELINALHRHGFEIVYFIESKGLAKFKKENPTIIRIIAKKKNGSSSTNR